MLRRLGVIAELPTPAGPIADELRRRDAHARCPRVANGTRAGRLRIIERSIHKFAGRPLAFEELRPEDIRRFVAEQMELFNTTSNAATINAALRAYLRWRATRGDASNPARRHCVARVDAVAARAQARRSRSSVGFVHPHASPGAATRSWAGAGSGLRTAEINRLQLDDIDWC